MSNLLQNGTGETVGDSLASSSPIYMSGNVWFVSSLTGTDAAGTAGKNKEKPLATLNQAVTNAAGGDLIVLLTGHTETRTTAIAITKSLTIVGIGTTSGKPSVQLKNNSAAASLLTFTTADIECEIRNVYFPAQVQSCSATKISNTQGCLRFDGCYFEANAFDTAAVITMPTAGTESKFEFVNSTMVSTGTSITSQPLVGITASALTCHARFDGAIFDDGTYGWSGDYALSVTMSGSACCLRGVGISQLRGAAVNLGIVRVWWQVSTSSGGARVNI